MDALAVVAAVGGLLCIGLLPLVTVVLSLSARAELRRLRLRIDQLEDHQRLSWEHAESAPAQPAPEPPPTPTASPTPEPTPALPPAAAPPAAAPPAAAPPAAAPPAAAPPAAAPPAAAPRPPGLSAERLAVYFGSAAGGLLMILATLMALAVAVDRGWLGPAARVCLGSVAGTAVWLLGTRLRLRGQRSVGSALSGAGLGALYGVLWAAHALYGFVPRLPTVVLMVSVGAIALLSAVRWRDRFMAHLGLLGGLLTPLLLSTGRNEPVPLFGYLLLLGGGAVLAAVRRGWADLLVTAAVGTVGLYLSWTAGWHQPDQLPVASGAALLLAVPFAAGALTRRSTPAVAQVATATSLVLSCLVGLWIWPIDPVFMDPSTGTEVLRSLGGGDKLVALAVVLVGLTGHAIAWRRRWWLVGLAASMISGLLAVVATAGWAWQGQSTPMVLGLMALGPLALGTLTLALPLAAGTDEQRAHGSAPLPLLAGLAVVAGLWDQALGHGGALGGVSPGVVEGTGATLAVLILLSLAGTLRSRHVGWLLASFVGVVLSALAASQVVEAVGTAGLAAPTLLGLAVFLPMPALAARFPKRPAVPVLIGAATTPAFFWPLYVAWTTAWTDAAIGLLPLLLACTALVTAVLLVRARRVDRSDLTLAIFVAVALMGLSAAIPLQLSRQWLTVAWGIEGAALAWLSLRLLNPLVRGASVVLGGTVAVRLLLNPAVLSYGDVAGLPILNWTLYTWGLPAVCLALSARWLAQSWPRSQRSGVLPGSVLPAVLRILAVLVGFALINVEVSQAFQDSGSLELSGHGVVQGMVRSLAWAAYGVTVLVAGLSLRLRHIRLLGFALVLLATAKVFAVDLWALSGFARVGSVLGLGVTLLLSAFLFERIVLRGADPDPDDAEST